VLFDATHAVQRPSALEFASGGDREAIPVLAAAAVAAGADGVFIETHPEPEKGLSDASTMLPVDDVPALLEKLKGIAELMGKAG
jgi:2-dehydro-3-deoxyphosphooctonate aldolase (KDO 8-P synthase)